MNKLFKKLTIALFVLALKVLMPIHVTSVWAEDTKSTEPATVTTMVAAEPKAASAPEAPAEARLTNPDNVTLDFNDADIRNVLRIISLKSGVNIVAGEEVKGSVTIRLVDVPWEKALQVVLKTYGFAYERDGNIIRVTTLTNLASEALDTQIFTLTHANATEIVKTLQEMLSERGSMRADERTNVLIVTDVPTIVYRIGQVLERLDKGTAQVLIEAKIMEMTVTDAEKMGIKWNAALELAGPSRPTTFPFESAREDFMSNFYPRGIPASTTQLVSDAGTLGAVLESPGTFPAVTNGNVNGAGDLISTFPFSNATDFKFGKIDFSQFSALIEAISSGIHNKILSEPRITVLSNQEASILVGEEIYIPKYERNSTTGKMEITGYDPKEIGINMKVTPQVNAKNEVHLTLAPEISNLVGFEELTPDIKVPRINIRNASTQVRLLSGETLVLGGLIKEDVVDEKTKFPVLGDLPILDRIFSHTNKTVIKTDLTFFITVTVLDEPVPGLANTAKPS
jgi:type IV pilus assembly protein PilQ